MLPDDRTTLLLSAFGRALSHQIRTPLSVISNELFYLQTLVAPEECQRSLDRCKHITDILTNACDLPLQPFNFSPLDLGALLRGTCGVMPSEQFLIQGDSGWLQQAFTMLCEVTQVNTSARSKCTCHINGESVVVLITAAEQPLEIDLDPKEKSFTSFTDFYNVHCHQDQLAPIFIDAILWAHDASISLRAEPHDGGVTIQCEIIFGLYHG